MRTRNTLILAILGLIALFAFIVSCQQEKLPDMLPQDSEQFLNIESAELKPFMFPDGSVEDRYFVEGDIVFSQEEWELMLEETNGGIDFRQYRTNRIVRDGTYKVLGLNSGNTKLTNKMKNGLRDAVKNYNNLNLDIRFTLSFGTNTNNADIVVYRVPGGAGGSAGFPTASRKPFKWVRINSGTNSFNRNVNEHVITHEIGHSVGLRHTDFFNRRCDGINEGSGGVIGAVHIPGTPTGIDQNSIMLSCFGSNENGEFSNNDKKALRRIY